MLVALAVLSYAIAPAINPRLIDQVNNNAMRTWHHRAQHAQRDVLGLPGWQLSGYLRLINLRGMSRRQLLR